MSDEQKCDGSESFSHTRGEDETWEVYDAQRIYLCRVCERCEKAKLSRYRPEILSGYDQSDVDEPIEPTW